ncbi:MAG: cation diffusion facilitator family transporter [Clostridium sp.]|nr:cation diffusion facilitator family transporter [Clostridium sp.]
MLKFLAKLFIKTPREYDDPATRRAYGVLCGAVGILLNILLFAGKFIAGSLAKSVAVTADAFNNLADASSSVITMIGFRLAGQKPDKEHPFGHGRFEYIAGLLVSAAIILMGVELLKTSIEKIIAPQAVEFSVLTAVILVFSVAVKIYMAVYNGSLGKKLASPALAAAAKDSLSDSIATAVVLISSAVGHFLRINIDGWCGAAVAVFVLRAGIMSVRDTLAPLLGTEPDPEFVKRINDIVLSYPEISAIHDLIIHDYGPGRQIISLHAEMPTESGSDIFKLHDIVDNAERRLRQELGCDATIHLDPVAAEDEQTQMLHERMEAALFEINSGLTMHDFRIVPGPTHTNLIFDVVVPYDNKMPQAEILEKIEYAAAELPSGKNGGKYYAVVRFDRPFT